MRFPKKLINLYGTMGDYRNDMNHFGFKKQPNKPETLSKKLESCYREFCDIIDGQEKLKLR